MNNLQEIKDFKTGKLNPKAEVLLIKTNLNLKIKNPQTSGVFAGLMSKKVFIDSCKLFLSS